MEWFPARLLSCLSCGLAIILQGCGNNGKTTTITTTSTRTTTSTTTTTIPHRTAPMTPAQAAEYLNYNFLNFDENNSSSPLGVTISMVGNPSSFYNNIYCSTFHNPLKQTGCWEGNTDCRMSAALYNHKMIVTKEGGPTVLGLNRNTGFVFNQSKVENYFGKCSYVWDGASSCKFNYGCGMGAVCGKGTCNVSGNAFANICPSTKEICAAQDVEVKSGTCSQFGGNHAVPQDHKGFQCLFPGPAFEFHMQSDFTPGKGYLREMANARMKFNSGNDDTGPKAQKWNEVVIDEHLMLPDIWHDPALVIPAFIYAKSKNAGGLAARYAQP